MKKLNKLSIDGIITIAGITIVNIINYGLNLFLGRWLGPDGFAEANLIATLVLLISFLGVAAQLVTANEIARSKSNRENLLKWMERKVLSISVVISILLIISSGFVSEYLNIEKPLVLQVVFVGIPFYLLMCVRRGYYQGVQKFFRFSMTFIVETAGRLFLTLTLLGLVLKIAPDFATAVISIGFLASFIAGFLYSRLGVQLKYTSQVAPLDRKALISFISIIAVYELSQILINNFDVVLTKHYFDNFEAGIYSSIALIGKMVYFGTWTIVTLLFPKVIEKEKKGEDHLPLFYGSLAIVFGAGILVTFLSWWKGDLIISILFGGSYENAGALLWLYALATTLFATSNVFAYYFMSLKNYVPVFIVLAAGIIQISAIIQFHDSLLEVILMQVFVMAGLALILLLFHFIKLVSFSKLFYTPAIAK